MSKSYNVVQPAEFRSIRSTSMQPSLRSGADWIASAGPDIQDEFLSELPDDLLRALPWLFEFWALPHQLPPEGDWKSWVILGGRGAGKTRAGAEWVRAMVEGSKPEDDGRARRVALVGETIDQVREVMVFGESGILACTPPDRRPDWIASRKMLEWPNGAVAQLFSAHDPESLRGPQFDCAWVDEIGCAAIDKATNQPNKFLDPKSSESAVPYYSDGTRDDFVQAQYLRALIGYWDTPTNNPVSGVYGGPMLDMSRAHVWAWDTRPYPAFPHRADIWSDAPNYFYGHWLNGRTSSEALAAVVAEICRRSGVDAVNTSALYGIVRGYTIDEVSDARAALQPLMLAFGFEAIEREGQLLFKMRDGKAASSFAATDLVESGELDGDIQIIRAPMAETAGRVRLTHVEADGNYEARSTEAIYPDEESRGVSQSEVSLALTATEARQVVERWLSEARVARDTARFALPPSSLNLGAGDVISLPDGSGTATYRIDHLDLGAAQLAEAVRVEPHIYVKSDEVVEPPVARPFLPPVPVEPVFLDLPLLTGAEVEHAPHLAVAAEPWPGAVAVYSSQIDDGYELNRLIEVGSVIGETETALTEAAPSVWDRGSVLRVRIGSGALSSVDELSLFNGANALAIGDGSAGNWEVLQFQTATLVAEDTYELSLLLRGQLGTDSLIPPAWPVGSKVVLLDGTPTQIELAISSRDLDRHYRIGPANRSLDDPSFVNRVEAFRGVGLRPFAPVHLRESVDGAGARQITWVRRTRIDGDNWSSVEVPLGEASELYLVQVVDNAVVQREETISSTAWSYSAAMQAADGVTAPFQIQVAQISERYGAGPFRRIEING